MIEFVFNVLQGIGFKHPLHPAFTHIPMGMVMGGFVFVLAAVIFKNNILYRTSYHCAILGLIGIPPTILFGILDWQYTYSGQLLTPIKIKFLAATLLTALLVVIIRIGNKPEKNHVLLLICYGLAFVCVINLGFWGGDLVFG